MIKSEHILTLVKEVKDMRDRLYWLQEELYNLWEEKLDKEREEISNDNSIS